MMRRVKKSHGSKNSLPNSRESQAVIRTIRQGKSFLVTTHYGPDGDALGSALALAQGLKKLRKRVKIYNQDPVPINLRFLPDSGAVTQNLAADERFDASFIVDCAEPERAGKVFQKHPGRGCLVVIDHHKKSGRAGDINLIEPKAPSTGFVVLKLLRELKVPLTRDIATAVYTTLVTDTGNFRYSNTDASVLRLAASLVEKGIEPWWVAKQVFESFPVERIFLLGKVLPTLHVSSDGRYASLTLTQQMLKETGATRDLSDEFINYPRSILGVEVAIQFRETEEGSWKVSFRSTERVDVAELAAQFGGGGHARAAGCELKEPFESARSKIFQAVEAALKIVENNTRMKS